MPLITRLLRIFTCGTLCWLMLAALWLGLPSPSREYSSHPGRYERETLRSGRPLIRIYDNEAWSADGYPLQATNDRRSFALSYKLEQMRNTTLLSLPDGLTINLNPEYVTSYPFVSQDRYTVVKTGDQDGINPPWFAKADSTLLFWWIQRDTATLTFQVTWKSPRTIELGVGTKQLLVLNFETSEKWPAATRSLLDDVALPRQSSSPSQMYAARVMILALIAPTGMLAMGLFGVIGPIVRIVWEIAMYLVKVGGFYCAFVAFVWVVRGRRPLAEDDLVSKFPGMEFFGGRGAGRRFTSGKKTVWGPSGPIEIEDDRDKGTQRSPIRNVTDFFRSSAPLDDLLATFASTRRLTEPIDWSSRSTSPRRGLATQAMPQVKSGRHRKVYSEDGLEDSGLIDLEQALPEKPGIALQRR